MSDPKGSLDGHMHYMRLAADQAQEIERLISMVGKSIDAGYKYRQEIERLNAELGDGTTGNKYRAELYDEVWQKSRDMGYDNVTMALTELSQLKSRQSGVVLPERSDPEGYSTGSPEWHAAHARNDCLDEVRRLNLAEQLNKASAGVDERAAFYAWFCKRHSYKHGTDTPQLSAAFEPFKAWQARAQLVVPPSAPETSVVVERELLERVERYFSGFVSDEPPAYALGSNGLATIRAILSSKGDV